MLGVEVGLDADDDKVVTVVPGSNIFPDLSPFVQIFTRNRVWDQVHRTLAFFLVEPPFLSLEIGSTGFPFSGASDSRNIDLSKYV